MVKSGIGEEEGGREGREVFAQNKMLEETPPMAVTPQLLSSDFFSFSLFMPLASLTLLTELCPELWLNIAYFFEGPSFQSRLQRYLFWKDIIQSKRPIICLWKSYHSCWKRWAHVLHTSSIPGTMWSLWASRGIEPPALIIIMPWIISHWCVVDI